MLTPVSHLLTLTNLSSHIIPTYPLSLPSGMHATLPAAVSSIFAKSGLGGFYRGYIGACYVWVCCPSSSIY